MKMRDLGRWVLVVNRHYSEQTANPSYVSMGAYENVD